MKYRKVGLRMCIISIVMIALCIPNQIQTANAAEGDSEENLRVYDEINGEWSEKGINLNLFPNRRETDGKKYDIQPEDQGDYLFRIENNLGYKAVCQIRIKASINEDSEDKTYPITYQLYRREENTSDTSLIGSKYEWKNPFDYRGNTIIRTEKIANGEEKEYVLSWKFDEANMTFDGGNYQLSLSVEAKQETDSDNDNTSDNPNDDKKDDNNSDNNGSNTNGSQNGNNNTSNDNKGNNINNGKDDSKGNDSSNNNNQNNKDNLNIDKTFNKGTESVIETNKKKVNTSDITTPVIYVAFMILMFGLILLVKSRKEN